MSFLFVFLLGMAVGTFVAYWLLGVRVERRVRPMDTVYQVVLPGQVLTSFTRRHR